MIVLVLSTAGLLYGGDKVQIITDDANFCQTLVKVLPFQGGVVAANTRNEILLIAENGIIVQRTGGFGSGRESYGKLNDIWTFSGINIYGVDFDRARVIKYDRFLNFKGVFENNPNWPVDAQFIQPLGLRIAQTSEWFIIDKVDQKLIKFDSRGEPEFMLFFTQGGDHTYFQDLQLLEINTELRHLYLYDAYLTRLFIIDYWGNEISSRNDITDITSIFSSGGSAYYLSGKNIFHIEGEDHSEFIHREMLQLPGNLRSIAGGHKNQPLIILTDEILIELHDK